MSSANDSIETVFIDANGLRFEVDVCGSGDRLALLLHGFPEHKFSWRFQLPMLARLGYTAWAPNLRGYGQSSRPAGVQAYAIEHLIDDVAALIDAAAARGVKGPTLLIAHDFGAIVAWTFALRRVRPLAHFIVMNFPHPALFLRHMAGWRQLRRSWYMFFALIPWLPEKLLLLQDARAIGESFRGMAIDKSRFPEEVLEIYRANARQPGAMRAMINYYRATLRNRRLHTSWRNAPRLETPTLMVWGEHDTALGKELTYGTQEWVHDLTLRYLPNVSHWVQQEAPETVNAMIEAWLLGRAVPEADAPAMRG